MKCFNFFKAKKEGSSVPGLRNHGNKVGSGSDLSKKSSRSLPSPRSVQELYKEKEHNLRVFSFSELKRATDGFSKVNKIGEGGFGKVYKGSIMPANGGSDPIVVAIKKLNQFGEQGHKQWVAEVQCLSIVDHPNLVKLLGYCAVNGDRGTHRLLVYEYVPNKSLEDHLFSRTMPSLPWITRLQIILGAAQGLAYLHEGMEVQVIYRDFKCSNVLLDDVFRPKLSDFGLAREGPTGNRSHVSTEPIGTRGYAAPEYVRTAQLTYKSDVWSFGVVLYEILTGRRTLEFNLPAVEQILLQWVKLYPADSKRFNVIVDPRLRNQYSLVSARKIARLADSCLNENAKERPDMSEVIEKLKDAIKDCENGSSFQKRNAAVSSLPSPRMNSSKDHPLPLPLPPKAR